MGRPDNPSRVYLDSCILISAVQQPEHKQITALFQLADQGKLELMISRIAFVEVLGKRRTDPYDAETELRVQALLDHPRFTPIEFGRAVAIRSRECALHHGLKPMDAIHLGSALDGNADVLMSADDDFPKGRLLAGMWIDELYVPGGDPLF